MPPRLAPLLDMAYEQLDAGGVSAVSFSELYAWLRGYTKRAAAARQLRLRSLRPETEPALMALTWDEETLRTEVETMLSRHALSAADLFRAYDDDSDGSLSRREVCTLHHPCTCMTP